jgi:hypothetical protein
MSDLNPHGVKVSVGGEEHELLFTIFVIDEIQSKIGRPLFDVINDVTRAVYTVDDLEALRTFLSVLTILINAEDDGKRTEKELAKKIVWNEITTLARAVVEAFGISLPEPDEEDEDEDPEDDDSPKAENGA